MFCVGIFLFGGVQKFIRMREYFHSNVMTFSFERNGSRIRMNLEFLSDKICTTNS